MAIEIKIPITSEYMHSYKLDLLKLILSKADGDHTLSYSKKRYSASRVEIEMNKENSKINLMWYGTSIRIENKLLPIRYPMYRGLIGHRVFIINRKHQSKFDKIKDLKNLQSMVGAQGFGWADIDILENAGLKQVQASYDNIFKMINKSRIDYFSRGVTEAYKEVNFRKDQLKEITVEKKLLLVYPFAMYFFTGKNNTEIAKVIENGFKNAYADGSFIEFYNNHSEIKNVRKQSNLNNRIRIDIHNPLMTKETLSLPKSLWN
ncbi:MAG: diguanylate cyclase [Campylobacteraceae bacterium]|nr:diguanylate cyclase [Campylobacteraceae bacterium]